MKRRKRIRSKHRYSSDRPIRSDKEDRLERSTFAGDIANDVAAWHGDDSLVIGLYGGWGSGKTSVKNLVLERLGKRKRQFPVIEFNPWQFSGTGNIASAFFKELRIALSCADASRKTQARADKLDRYAKSLNVGGTTLSEVGRLLSLIGVPGGAIVHEFGKGIKKSAEVAREGSDALEATASKNEKSVLELKRDLTEELSQLPQPVLVVIDDIDRLTTNEILEVFQLVKANADFPKLIYLLLFERSIVSKALGKISGGRGDEFLEKIVQVGYHVPHASREAVQKVLFAGLNEILATPGIDQRWDKHRWSEVYLDGIAGYFQNLRHVYRFLGSFDFHVHQFHSGTRFEVNPIDLIGLETLRVFEPDVYEQLAAAKRILTRDEGKSLFGEVKREVVDAAITSIISRARAERRDTVKRIVELLFPPITRALDGEREVSRHKYEWLREARICHAELFDKYFTFTVPAGDLSQIELDSLVDATKDRPAFVTQYEAMSKRDLLKPAFERLDAFKDDIPTSALPSLIRALSDLSDTFPDPTPDGLIDFDVAMYAFRLVYFGLRRETNANRRFEILRDAFNDSSGLLLAVETVSNEERVGDREARAHEFVIDEAQLPALKEICVRKLREAAADGSLRKHRRVTMLLWRWSEWAPFDEVRAWVSKQVATPKGAAWLLGQLVSEVRSHGRETKITPYMKLSTVERFADVTTLELKIKRLDQSKIAEKEKIGLREFRRALKRRQEGKPEFDGWNRELED